jgi:hypothetical protein
MSNKQAETRALDLAAAYLQTNDARGYDWKCLSASPDLMSPKNMDRKMYTKWSVLVEYSRNGAVLDGPGVLLVDIAAGSCKLFGESAARLNR